MCLTACLLSNDFQVLSRGLEMLAWHGAEKSGDNLKRIAGFLFRGDFEDAETEVMKMDKKVEDRADEMPRGDDALIDDGRNNSKKKRKKKRGRRKDDGVGPAMRSLVAGTARGTALDRYKSALSQIRSLASSITVNVLVYAIITALSHSDISAAAECLERLSGVDPSLVLRHAPSTSPNASSKFFTSSASPLETIFPRYLLEKFASVGLFSKLPEVVPPPSPPTFIGRVIDAAYQAALLGDQEVSSSETRRTSPFTFSRIRRLSTTE